MTSKDFDKVCMDTMDRCMGIMRKKGPDYASGDDRLDNFKHSRLGNAPMVVLGEAFDKQLAAVFIYINKGQLTGEPIELRIADAINYLLLLQGLVCEGKDERETDPKLHIDKYVYGDCNRHWKGMVKDVDDSDDSKPDQILLHCES